MSRRDDEYKRYIAHVQAVLEREGWTLDEAIQQWQRDTAGKGPVAQLAWWFTTTTVCSLPEDFPEVLAYLRKREAEEAAAMAMWEQAIHEDLAARGVRVLAAPARMARAAA